MFFPLKVVLILANSADPDEMQHYAAFHQGLYCLPRSKQPSGKEIHHNLIMLHFIRASWTSIWLGAQCFTNTISGFKFLYRKDKRRPDVIEKSLIAEKKRHKRATKDRELARNRKLEQQRFMRKEATYDLWGGESNGFV